MDSNEQDIAALRQRVTDFLAAHDPTTMAEPEFWRARFDAGLAWVHYPHGLGGLGMPREYQPVVDQLFAESGVGESGSNNNGVGLGMAAPTILAWGSEQQQHRYLRPLWCGEEIWCQLFSEPGAGSDLAALATRAVRDGDDWVVNGQKVWTSNGHLADFAILVARTDPTVPKHAGLTYFLCDMHSPGIEVRPLRQITGEAEFNEVFLNDVRIPDSCRLGAEGDGWQVATTTLNAERVSLGGQVAPREGGMLAPVTRAWREQPDGRTPELRERLLKLWVESEVTRLASMELREKLAAGQPGPEGAAHKISYARLTQQLTDLEIDFLGDGGLRYPSWEQHASDDDASDTLSPGYRYLRTKGFSIEGGTSEILRNIVAERILGLPAETRTDKDRPWKELAQ